MAISLTISPTQDEEEFEIQETTRADRSINATITASGDEGETIDSISFQLDGTPEPGLTITSNEDTLNIVGKFIDPFLDTFKYVEKGSSDKIEEPTIVVGVANMPSNKDLYELNQDTRLFEMKTYRITVNYEDEFFVSNSANFIVTQKILNDLEGIRSFMDTYYD